MVVYIVYSKKVVNHVTELCGAVAPLCKNPLKAFSRNHRALSAARLQGPGVGCNNTMDKKKPPSIRKRIIKMSDGLHHLHHSTA